MRHALSLSLLALVACASPGNGAPHPRAPAAATAFGAYSGHTIVQGRPEVGEAPAPVPPPAGARPGAHPLYSPIEASLAWVGHEDRPGSPALRLRLVEPQGMEVHYHLFELATGWSGPVTSAQAVAPRASAGAVLYAANVTWNGRREQFRVVRDGDDLLIQHRAADATGDTGFVDRDRILLPHGATVVAR
jgi:hypothetical protein